MTESSSLKPRRSALYMPCSNTRALDKAQILECDAVIFDLEDAVSPDKKIQARQLVINVLKTGGFGNRELVVRCNGLDSPWGHDDLIAIAATSADGVCLPKVEKPETIRQVVCTLTDAGDQTKGIWAMAETPLGIQAIDEIAQADPRLRAILMGTSDLAKELRIPHTPDPTGFLYSLYCRCQNCGTGCNRRCASRHRRRRWI